MRNALASLLLAALLVGCSATEPAAPTGGEQLPSPDDCWRSAGLNAEDHERAVYKVAFDELFLGQPTKFFFRTRSDGPWPKPRLLLIRRETDGWLERFREFRKDFALASQAAVNDFEVKNSKPRLLPTDLNSGTEHKFISDKELNGLIKVKGGLSDWSKYYEQYQEPEVKGVLSLSQVGFNEDFTEAVVYLGHGCGRGCGYGAYLFLRREGCNWQVEEYYGAWMS